MQPLPSAFIEEIVPATRFGSQEPTGREHWRVVGTTDIDGNGVTHDLHSVDPFIFLDESLVPAGAGGLGAGRHPHSGLTALTYLAPDSRENTNHGKIKPWDNFSGFSGYNNAGGLYLIEAGQGVVHDEQNETETGFMHQLQLWVNMGSQDGKTSQAQSQLYTPEQIPIANPSNGVKVRVLCGKQFNVSSPAKPINPMLYLHVNMKPHTQTVLEIPEKFRGFVYVLAGKGIFADTDVKAREAAVLGQNIKTTQLNIENKTEDKLSFVLIMAEPQESVFYKLLGHSGALISSSKDEVREKMHEYEAKQQVEFGKELER